MRAMLTLGLAAAILAGCAHMRQPVQMTTTFNVDEHRPYYQAGTNTIKGQGFLRQKGRGVVTCAGNDVYLMPATPFFRELVNHVRAGEKPEPTDSTYKLVLKKSQCNAQGNFEFGGVANGNWFVVTEVKWSVGYSQQGGALLEEVAVAHGETVQVLLTDKDWIGR